MPAGDRPAADPGELDAQRLGGLPLEALRHQALTWLAPSISHELANPLAALVAFSGLLAGDARLPGELRDDVRMLGEEAERTSRLVRTVLELLRDRPAVAVPVEVGSLFDEVLALAAPRTTDIELVRHVDDPPPVAETDPSRLRQLVLVLVVEALRELGERPRGGRLEVRLETIAPGRVATSFELRRPSDSGDISPRLPAGETPLPALGGTLTVERAGTGGRFTLDLPGATVAAADAAPTGAGADDATRLTVLVCDDEESIRALLVRVLERDGLRAIAAGDGPTALAAIEHAPVHVVITDHRMTGMSGIELYERAVELRPGLRTRFVVMSGEPGSDELRAFSEGTGVRVLPKPFDLPAIPALIREIAREDGPAPQRG